MEDREMQRVRANARSRAFRFLLRLRRNEVVQPGRMRHHALILSLALSAAALAQDQDYAARYDALRKQNEGAQIEPFLNQWREKRPNDPEAWVASANYYFNQGQTVISTKKPEKGDFALTDKNTGKSAGSVSFEGDKAATNRSVELLKEATTKFPDRLDIWCGLAFIQQENGDFDSELATLKKMSAYAHDHSAQLRWQKGENLAEPADQFV